MRWLADECVDAGLVTKLLESGHDVVYALETLSGTSDTYIVHRAIDENRLLLTEDKDFGELVFRQRLKPPGIVFLRIPPEQRSFKWVQLRAVIERQGGKLYGRYTVVETSRFRTRVMPQIL